MTLDIDSLHVSFVEPLPATALRNVARKPDLPAMIFLESLTYYLLSSSLYSLFFPQSLKNEESIAAEGIQLTTNVPADASAVVIAGPKKPFNQIELEKLDEYLKNNGRIFCLIDPMAETGLEKWLKDKGIDTTDNIIIERDPTRIIFHKDNYWDYYRFQIIDYPRHIITKKLENIQTLFPLVRGVTPVNRPGEIKTAIILDSSANSWLETNLNSTLEKKGAVFEESEDKKGPVPFGVVMQNVSPNPANGKKNTWKMAIIGDSDFIANSPIIANYEGVNVSITGAGNKDLFMNTIKWLIEEEETISISAKPEDDKTLILTRSQNTKILCILSAIFILIAASGLVVILGFRRK